MCLHDLTEWSPHKATPFPYDTVVDAYRRVGKHFVPTQVTDALARVRDAMGEPARADADRVLLRDFLHVALDKTGGYYDYRTYLGLALLPMCSVEDPPDIIRFARARRDRLTTLLVNDLLAFEHAASEGHEVGLPEMRPDGRTVERRIRIALRFVRPVLARLGLGGGDAADCPARAVRQLQGTVEPELSLLDRKLLRISMLPVYVAHDEYLFIRVLQLFEATFALLAVHLSAAVRATTAGDWVLAAEHVTVAEDALHESAPLFSLLGTMQREAFRTFRAYTEGASAIQSRNYKTVELLCRRPDDARLCSVAYTSVPEVQEQAYAGLLSLDDAFESARRALSPPLEQVRLLQDAMDGFATVLLRWRQSHYRLAVAMLGERTGTGYTEGTPYLNAVQSIPVFRNVVAARTAASGHGD